MFAKAREATIDMIAAENHIPRFIAARVYNLLADRLSKAK